MRLVRILTCGAVLAVAVSCKRDTTGSPVTLDPTAGLRYINLVPDTAGMDFRIIDIVGDAPNTTNATFRQGGAPYGVTNSVPTQPPYLPVRSGSPRHIRVFRNGTTPAVASTVMFDTSFTFDANQNYTFILYGYSNSPANGTPAVNALIVKDSVPTLAAGKIGFRAINLAPNLSSSLGVPVNVNTPVDINVGIGNVAYPAGTATFSNIAFGNVTAYVPLDTNVVATALFHRVVVTQTGTTTPLLFASAMPSGTVGTPTANPTAGSRVAGSAITAVIVPRSVATTSATQASAAKTITTITRSNDTATVTVPAASPHGLAVGDVTTVTGATQPEYNGVAVVIQVPSTTSFTYRLTGTPVTPATGAPVYRAAKQGLLQGLDYSIPSIIFLVDQQPLRTAP